VILRVGGSKAPENMGVGLRHINWGGPVTAVATTLSAVDLAAAIPVPDQICLAVVRIYAGADPRNGRRFRSGRTGVDPAAAAGAQRAAKGAIAPIGAFRVVLALGIAGEVGRGFGALARLTGKSGKTGAATRARPSLLSRLRREVWVASRRVRLSPT